MSEQRHFQQADGRVYSLGGEGCYHTEGSIRDVSDRAVQVVPLDAIVIRREDLPEVVHNEYGSMNELRTARTVVDLPAKPHELYQEALERIAIGQRILEMPPPVDENAVVELHRLIDQHAGSDRSLAEHLVRSGVRAEHT